MPRRSSGKRPRNQEDHPRRAVQKRSDDEVDDLVDSQDGEAEEQQPVPRSEADDLPSSAADTDTSADTVASFHQHQQQLFASEEAKEQPQPGFVPDALNATGLAGAQAAAAMQAGQAATLPLAFPGQAMVVPPGYGIVPLLYPTTTSGAAFAWHPYGAALPPISYFGMPQGMITPNHIIQQQLQQQPEPAVIPQQQQQQPMLISQQHLWMPPFQQAEYMQQQQEHILHQQHQMQIVQQQHNNHAFQMEAGGDEISAPSQRPQEDEAPSEQSVEAKGTAFQGSSPATMAPNTSIAPAARKEGRRTSTKKSTSTSTASSTADAYHDFASATSMTPATKQAATTRSHATKKSSPPSSSVAKKTRSPSPTNTTTATTPALKKISKPKRPLNAYNFFFRDERSRMEDSKIAFEELGRRVSQQWKKVSPTTRAKYQAVADQDRVRYEKEKVLYLQYQRDLLQQYREEDDQAAAAAAAAAVLTTAASANEEAARHELADAAQPEDKTGEIAPARIEAKGDDPYEGDSGDPEAAAR